MCLHRQEFVVAAWPCRRIVSRNKNPAVNKRGFRDRHVVSYRYPRHQDSSAHQYDRGQFPRYCSNSLYAVLPTSEATFGASDLRHAVKHQWESRILAGRAGVALLDDGVGDTCGGCDGGHKRRSQRGPNPRRSPNSHIGAARICR